MTISANTLTHIATARVLGELACAAGLESAPVVDKKFMSLYIKLVAENGDFNPKNMLVMDAWISGWHETNAAKAMI